MAYQAKILIDICNDSELAVPECPFEQGKMLLLASASIDAQYYEYRKGRVNEDEVQAIRECFAGVIPNFTPSQKNFKKLRNRLREEGLSVFSRIK